MKLWRITALVTLCCFVFTTVLGDIFVEAAVKTVGNTVETPQWGVSTITKSAIELPPSLGTIKDSFLLPQQIPTIIHIQDAHCNYSAQRKIAEIIDYFHEKYGLNTVNLEGGEGKYDVSSFTDIKDSEVREKVSDYFVKEGIVNGAEYYAINNPDKVKLWGVEDTELYLENLNVYRDFLKHKDEVDVRLKEIEGIFSGLKREIYSKELLEFDEKYNEYKETSLKFEDYIAYLAAASEAKAVLFADFPNIDILIQTLGIERNIAFERADKEREILIDELSRKMSKNSLGKLVAKTVEFKKELIGPREFYVFLLREARVININLEKFPQLSKYVEYINLYEKMDKSALMEEITRLEDKIKESLYENDKQRELGRLSKNLIITKNLFNINLTGEDYKYYKENEKTFDTLCPSLNQYRRALSQFYEYSSRRDQAFLKRIKRTPNPEPRTTILITGGFHTENLSELFKKNNISYVTIMPNFKNSEGYECPYFNLLSGKTIETLKVLISEVSNLALYTDFCENVVKVYSVPEIEAKKLWLKLAKAVFEEKKDITIHNRQYSFHDCHSEDGEARSPRKRGRIYKPIEGLQIDGKQVYAKTIESGDLLDEESEDTCVSSDFMPAFSLLDRVLVKKLENEQVELTIEIDCSDSKNPEENALLPKSLKLNKYEKEQISDYLDKLIEGDISKGVVGIKNLSEIGLLPKKFNVRFSDTAVIQKEQDTIVLPRILFKANATLKYILVSEFKRGGLESEGALGFYASLTWREQEEIIFYITELCNKDNTKQNLLSLLIKETRSKYNLDPEFIVNENRELFLNKVCIDPWTGEDRFKTLYGELRGIADRLLLAEGMNPSLYELHLLDDLEENAFVFRYSNHIYVNLGLLKTLLKYKSLTKDTVAFILAHEITHIVQGRDEVDSGEIDSRFRGKRIEEYLRILKEIYAMEYDADYKALKKLDKAGFRGADSHIAFEAITRMIKDEGDKETMFGTHPELEERIRKIKEEYTKSLYTNYRKKPEKFSDKTVSEVGKRGVHREFECSIFNCKNFDEINKMVNEAKNLRDIELIKRWGLSYVLYQEACSMAEDVYNRLSKSDKRYFYYLKKYINKTRINFRSEGEEENENALLSYYQNYFEGQNKQSFKTFIEKAVFSHIRAFLRDKEAPPVITAKLFKEDKAGQKKIDENLLHITGIITPVIEKVLSKKLSNEMKGKIIRMYSDIVSKEEEFSRNEGYNIKIYDFREYFSFLEAPMSTPEKQLLEEEKIQLSGDQNIINKFIKFPVFCGLYMLDNSLPKTPIAIWSISDDMQKETVSDVIKRWLSDNRRILSLGQLFELREIAIKNGLKLEKEPRILGGWMDGLIKDNMANASKAEFKKYEDIWLSILKDAKGPLIDERFIYRMEDDREFCLKVLKLLKKDANPDFDEVVSGCIASSIKNGTKLKFLGLGASAYEDLNTLTSLFPNFDEHMMWLSFLVPIVKYYALNEEDELCLIEKGIWLTDLRNKDRGQRKKCNQKTMFSGVLLSKINEVNKDFIESELISYFKDYKIEPEAIRKLSSNTKKLLYFFKAGGMKELFVLRRKFHRLEKDNTDEELFLFYQCLKILRTNQQIRGMPVSLDSKEAYQLKEEIAGQYSLTDKDTLESFFSVRTWDEYILYMGLYLLFKKNRLDTEELEKFNLFDLDFSGYKAFFGEMPAKLSFMGELPSTEAEMAWGIQAFLTGLIQGYNRLPRHKITREKQFKMFDYIVKSEKGFDELFKEFTTFLPPSSYLNYALYHLFIFKLVSPLTGHKISLEKMYDPDYIKTLIDSSPQKGYIEKHREELRKYMHEDKRIELLNLYLMRTRMKEISDFYSILKGEGEENKIRKFLFQLVSRSLSPPVGVLYLLVLKRLSKLASMDLSSKKYNEIYRLIQSAKWISPSRPIYIEQLLEHLMGKREHSRYKEMTEEDLRAKLKLYLQIFCFSEYYQMKFQLQMFLKHFIFQKLRVFSFFEKHLLRNAVRLEDTETGGIDSQLDILLAYQSGYPYVILRPSETRPKNLKHKNTTWRGKYENVIKKYFLRPSNTRDYLIKTLIESHMEELSCEELHELTKDFYQLSLREKYNLKAIEKDRAASPKDFEGFDNEFNKICEVYFPGYSYTRDDLLLQLIEEKVVSRKQYEKISEKLLLNQDNLKKEEIQNHLFWGDKLKWMVKEMSAKDKADFLLWVLDAKKKKPELIFAIETDLNITLDHLKELFASSHKGYYNRIGMSLRKDLLPTLLYGKGGIFTDTKIERLFLDNLFRGIIPKGTRNKDVYKKIWDAVFSVVDLDRKIDIMVNLSKAFSEIPRNASGKIEKGMEGLLIKSFLESCGIIGVKLGQILYSMDIEMSSNIRKELASLTGSANSLAKGTTFSVMDNVFGEFQDYYLELLEPLGSASIKMVYKAKRPKDSIDDVIALKIKKPEVEQKINEELRYLSKILKILRTQGIDVPKNLEEKIMKQVKKELDFYLEWENQKTLNKIAREFKETSIPQDIKIKREFISDLLKGMAPEFINEIMNFFSAESNQVRKPNLVRFPIEVPVAYTVLGKNKGMAMLEPIAKGRPLSYYSERSEKSISPQDIIQIKRENAIFLLFQIFAKGIFHEDLHNGNLFIDKDFTASVIDLGSVGRISLEESMEFLRVYLALNINSFSNGVFGAPIVGDIISWYKLRPESQKQIVETIKKYNPEKTLKEINREVRSFLIKDRTRKDKASSLHKLFSKLDAKGIAIPEGFLDLSKAMTAANSIFKDSKKNNILSPGEMLGLIQTFIEYRKKSNPIRAPSGEAQRIEESNQIREPNLVNTENPIFASLRGLRAKRSRTKQSQCLLGLLRRDLRSLLAMTRDPYVHSPVTIDKKDMADKTASFAHAVGMPLENPEPISKNGVGDIGEIKRNVRQNSMCLSIKGNTIYIDNDLINRHTAFGFENRQAFIEFLKEFLTKDLAAQPIKQKELVVSVLDTSEYLFEDHIANGFIGIHRSLFEKLSHAPETALKLLKIGLKHELAHEAGLAGQEAEQALLKQDIKNAIDIELDIQEVITSGLLPENAPFVAGILEEEKILLELIGKDSAENIDSAKRYYQNRKFMALDNGKTLKVEANDLALMAKLNFDVHNFYRVCEHPYLLAPLRNHEGHMQAMGEFIGDYLHILNEMLDSETGRVLEQFYILTDERFLNLAADIAKLYNGKRGKQISFNPVLFKLFRIAAGEKDWGVLPDNYGVGFMIENAGKILSIASAHTVRLYIDYAYAYHLNENRKYGRDEDYGNPFFTSYVLDEIASYAGNDEKAAESITNYFRLAGLGKDAPSILKEERLLDNFRKLSPENQTNFARYMYEKSDYSIKKTGIDVLRKLLSEDIINRYNVSGYLLNPLLKIIAHFPQYFERYIRDEIFIENLIRISALGVGEEYAQALITLDTDEKSMYLRTDEDLKVIIDIADKSADIARDFLKLAERARKYATEGNGRFVPAEETFFYAIMNPVFISSFIKMTPEVRRKYAHEASVINNPVRDVLYSVPAAEILAAARDVKIVGLLEKKLAEETFKGLIFNNEARGKFISLLSGASADQDAILSHVSMELLSTGRDFKIVDKIRTSIHDAELREDLIEAVSTHMSFCGYLSVEDNFEFIVSLAGRSKNLAQACRVHFASKEKSVLAKFREQYEKVVLEEPEDFAVEIISMISGNPALLEERIDIGKCRALYAESSYIGQLYMLAVRQNPELLKSDDTYNEIIRLIRDDKKNGITLPHKTFSHNYNRANRHMRISIAPADNTLPYGYQLAEFLIKLSESRSFNPYAFVDNIEIFKKIHPENLKVLAWPIRQSVLWDENMNIRKAVLEVLSRVSSVELNKFFIHAFADYIKKGDYESVEALIAMLSDETELIRLNNLSEGIVRNVTGWARMKTLGRGEKSYRRECAINDFISGKILRRVLTFKNGEIIPDILSINSRGIRSRADLIEITDEELRFINNLFSGTFFDNLEKVQSAFGIKSVKIILSMIRETPDTINTYLGTNYAEILSENVDIIFGENKRFEFGENVSPILIELLNKEPDKLRVYMSILKEILGQKALDVFLSQGNYHIFTNWVKFFDAIDIKSEIFAVFKTQIKSWSFEEKAGYLGLLSNYRASKILPEILSMDSKYVRSWASNVCAFSLVFALFGKLNHYGIKMETAKEFCFAVLKTGIRNLIYDLNTFADILVSSEHIIEVNPLQEVLKIETAFIGTKQGRQSLKAKVKTLKHIGNIAARNKNSELAVEIKKILKDIILEINSILRKGFDEKETPLKMAAIENRFMGQLFGQITGIGVIDETMLNEEGITSKLVTICGLYFDLLRHTSGGSYANREKMRQLIKKLLSAYQSSKGDKKGLQKILLSEKENIEQIGKLKKAGYSESLWKNGVEIETEVLPSSQVMQLENIKRTIAQVSYEIIEIAVELKYQPDGIEIEELLQKRFFAYEEAGDFVCQMKKDLFGKVSIQQRLDRVEQILVNIKKIEGTKDKVKATGPAKIRIVIKKDFIEEATAGVGVPGCFSPNGLHREMPIVHALEANSFFALVYDEKGTMFANTVLALTDKGAVVFGVYNNRPDLDIDEALVKAWIALLRAAPAVILPKLDKRIHTIGGRKFAEINGIGSVCVQPITVAKDATFFKAMYYDFGKSSPNGDWSFANEEAIVLKKEIFPEAQEDFKRQEKEEINEEFNTETLLCRLEKEERKNITKSLFELNLNIQLQPVLSNMDYVILKVGDEEITAIIDGIKTRSDLGKYVQETEKKKLREKLKKIRTEFKLKKAFDYVEAEIRKRLAEGNIVNTAIVQNILYATLTEKMALNLNEANSSRFKGNQMPIKEKVLSEMIIQQLNIFLDKTLLSDNQDTQEDAVKGQFESLFGEYVPSFSEIVVRGEMTISRDNKIDIMLKSADEYLPVYDQNLVPEGKAILQFELYQKHGRYFMEVLDIISKNTVSTKELYRTFESLAQYSANYINRDILIESETAMFRTRTVWDGQRFEQLSRKKDIAKHFGWQRIKEVQSNIKTMWIKRIQPIFEEQGIVYENMATKGINQEEFGYYEKVISPAWSNITGNIIKGFTAEEAADLRKKIEKDSGKTLAGNESTVKLVEERCQGLLENNGSIGYLLRKQGVSEDEIKKVTYALEHPKEAFKWFEAIVEGEERYLLGHETALAINIVNFLTQKEAELEIDNLLDEYIFHEALENTGLKHREIIDFTSMFFRQKIYSTPYETPLGAVLRMFIQQAVAPEAEIVTRNFEDQRAEESERLGSSAFGLRMTEGDPGLRMTEGNPGPRMAEGNPGPKVANKGTLMTGEPEFKPWIDNIPKSEFVPFLPENIVSKNKENIESRQLATVDALNSEPPDKSLNPIALVGLPEGVNGKVDLEDLKREIGRGLARAGHGDSADTHKVDFFFISRNKIGATEKSINDILDKYKNRGRQIVLFKPENIETEFKADMLTIVTDAYTDFDFSLKEKFVDINSRIAIARLIGWYKCSKNQEGRIDAMKALRGYLEKVMDGDIPKEKEDLNKLLNGLLLKIRPVDYKGDYAKWEITQKAFAASL